MAKRVLAAELGTVSETFSRTPAKFRQQKLLAVKGKTVTVLSPAKLSALLRRNLGRMKILLALSDYICRAKPKCRIIDLGLGLTGREN